MFSEMHTEIYIPSMSNFSEKCPILLKKRKKKIHLMDYQWVLKIQAVLSAHYLA